MENNYNDFREMVPDYSDSSNQSSEFEIRVGFGRRLAAYIIDVIFLGIISSIFIVLTVDISQIINLDNPMEFFTNPEKFIEITRSTILPTALIGVLYYLIEIFVAATPGKMILGIAIGDERRFLATKSQLIKRFIFKYSSNLINLMFAITGILAISYVGSLASIIVFVGYFFVLRETKQAFHDNFAKTAVFYRNEIAQSTYDDYQFNQENNNG